MRALIWPDQADSSVHSISSLDRYKTHFVDQYQGISCVEKKYKLSKLTKEHETQIVGRSTLRFAKFTTLVLIGPILNS